MKKELIKLANHFDRLGEFSISDKIDSILKSAQQSVQTDELGNYPESTTDYYTPKDEGFTQHVDYGKPASRESIDLLNTITGPKSTGPTNEAAGAKAKSNVTSGNDRIKSIQGMIGQAQTGVWNAETNTKLATYLDSAKEMFNPQTLASDIAKDWKNAAPRVAFADNIMTNTKTFSADLSGLYSLLIEVATYKRVKSTAVQTPAPVTPAVTPAVTQTPAATPAATL